MSTLPTSRPSTPFAVVDRDRLQANIDRVARLAADRGQALRPHAKTHKCPQIAALQLEAGASGLTVATLGEAEVFADAGCTDLLIAYPVWWDADRAGRVAQLAARVRLAVGVDSVEAVQHLASLLGTAPGRPLAAPISPPTLPELVVEVDCGHHRSGCAPQDAGAVARAGLEAGFVVRGVFAFPGHSYTPTGREEVAEQEARDLAVAADSLRGAGILEPWVSGGSTPTVEHEGDGFDEVRPGVYVVGDAQQWELGTCSSADVALTVHATVVSHAGGRLVLDAGSKALGADRAGWATGFGRLLDHPEARIELLSEHHAVAVLPEDTELPPLGTEVRVVPNHACNAVNLTDRLWVEVDGRLVESWPVAARGLNA
ncbi:alanine racemase [Kytococcus sedentarius]|uniref:Predicted amino acid aldolase or racemase n=1 Tax=Kytococcus sedentarius (strain ATCC 14392 / DSM 20547 / JCM 11482 / CCUG 33030 / NBRC 15357 / NCTC 11040 / CCM 314 / 541) TaxID=478801 RepID=C7NKR0_KYTSD|nr:alanine racemase [Kytococcus sedentarius]ACV05546.1 predicted amino acid aldolase or racemase [Kytococcus sedentarius DSM 20547]QQB63979.1 alanine racemase [Kytococcus sedentarius]STX13041.1 D-threonine aldolase [Kytococcus sedentarius]